MRLEYYFYTLNMFIYKVQNRKNASIQSVHHSSHTTDETLRLSDVCCCFPSARCYIAKDDLGCLMRNPELIVQRINWLVVAKHDLVLSASSFLTRRLRLSDLLPNVLQCVNIVSHVWLVEQIYEALKRMWFVYCHCILMLLFVLVFSFSVLFARWTTKRPRFRLDGALVACLDWQYREWLHSSIQ